MDKMLCESKAWIGSGLRNGNIKVYKDRIEFYYGKKIIKNYAIEKMAIINKNDNGVSTKICFIYDSKKENLYISNDKVDKVLEIIGDNKNISENEWINYDTTYKSNMEDKNNNKQNNGTLEFLYGVICLIGGFIWFGYTQNWFNFLGINKTGISSGCYYQESEKDALCFKGKKAYFKSNDSTEYYVTYTYDEAIVKDAYGKTITSCRKIKDSKNIICGSAELHKK